MALADPIKVTLKLTAVLKVQAGALDMDYLKKVAVGRGVADLLDKALREAAQ
jgi:hypothetical protein